ncbi:7727_t:CDS:2 [Gigaspora rosea]|nr:7727_t:CDS:2 [Gigaspora rosea]
MSSTKSKETKTALTNEQRKIELVNWIKQTMGLSVHQSTVSCLLKNKEAISKNSFTKRQRTVQYPALEDILYRWILQSQDSVILSDKIIIEKAKQFAKLLNIPESDFKFSHSWLYKFKKRHSLQQIKKHGEDASVDDAVINAAIP